MSVSLSLTVTSRGGLPNPNVFFSPLSCIAWLFKTLMQGFHYGKCCLCPGRLEKAAKVSLAAILSTCCPGNQRQGKQDLSDGKCQLQADLESRKQSGEGRGGRARLSLLPSLAVPLPSGRLLCEGEGLFLEWRECGERRHTSGDWRWLLPVTLF